MFTPRITLNWRMTKPPPLVSPLSKVSIEISFSGVHKEALPKRFPKKLCLYHYPFHCYPRFFDFADSTLFKGWNKVLISQRASKVFERTVDTKSTLFDRWLTLHPPNLKFLHPQPPMPERVTCHRTVFRLEWKWRIWPPIQPQVTIGTEFFQLRVKRNKIFLKTIWQPQARAPMHGNPNDVRVCGLPMFGRHRSNPFENPSP